MNPTGTPSIDVTGDVLEMDLPALTGSRTGFDMFPGVVNTDAPRMYRSWDGRESFMLETSLSKNAEPGGFPVELSTRWEPLRFMDPATDEIGREDPVQPDGGGSAPQAQTEAERRFRLEFNSESSGSQ